MSIYTVSIHALLAECDVFRSPLLPYPRSFNPRTPCGVRRFSFTATTLPPQFQSTHSLRSATALEDLDMIDVWVSIHALLAECDPGVPGVQNVPHGFNPRTPCGVRQ